MHHPIPDVVGPSGKCNIRVLLPHRPALVVWLSIALHACAIDLYVSPDGNDSYGGTGPAAAVRTLQAARDLARTRIPSMSEDIVVHLLEGRYYLGETVVFDERDGGRNGHRVIYRAHNTGKAELCGGVLVGGWTETGENGIWQATVPDVPRKIRTFSVNGTAARMAELRGGAYARGAYQVDNGILFDADKVYANGGDIEISRRILFMQHHAAVKEIVPVGDKAAYVMQQPMWSLVLGAPYVAPECSGAWGIRNAFELLDGEGEFYFDRVASVLYYKPYPEQDMRTADAIAAVCEGLIRIEGASLDQPVRNLEFWGITFSHDAWQMMHVDGSYGSTGTQSVALIVGPNPDPESFAHPYKGNCDGLDVPQAAVEVSCASGIHFERNTFEHLGSMGISLVNGVDSSRIIGNRFSDIASGAICVGHPKHGVLGDHPEFVGGERQPRAITVTNNHIRNSCTEYHQAQPIVTFFTQQLDLSYNDIHGAPYSLVSVGYGWQDFNDLPADNITCRDNTIRNNRLSGACTRLGDGGAIYLLGRMEGTNTIAGNFIFCDPYNEGLRCRGQNWGLYADQGPKNAVWRNNVVEDVEIWMNSLRDSESTWRDNWTTSTKQEWRAHEPVNTHVYPLGERPQDVTAIYEASGLEPKYLAAWDGLVDGTATTVNERVGGLARAPRMQVRALGGNTIAVAAHSDSPGRITVTICDLQGRPLAARRRLSTANRRTVIPLGSVAAGLRLVVVENADRRTARAVMTCDR